MSGSKKSSNRELRSLLIRPGTAADIAAMMQLEKHAATAGHWSREQYETILSGSESPERRTIVLVIEEGHEIVGFLVARTIEAECELENVAVAGSARRRGLGSRLMSEFMDLARAEGATAVFLEVRDSNRAARLLYEKWAFVESGRRKRYYRDPEEDAILYRLELC